MPPLNAGRVRLVGALIALAVVGAICYLAATYDTFPWDEDALTAFQSFRSGWLDDAAIAASSFGHVAVAVLSIVMLPIVLWAVRRRADSLAALLVLAADALNQGLKVVVDRPRPEFSLLTSSPSSPAFPSGHSFHAIVLFGLLIVIAGELIKPPRIRRGIQALLCVVILAVGASRVYLGVHWPSDVIGAYVIGGLSLVAILWVRKKLLSRGLQ